MTEQSFRLEIMTPERMFLQELVEALNVTTVDGKLEILKGHEAITVPLTIGNIEVKRNGEWKSAFQSEGFLEVNNEGVFVFVQACEWPENIDTMRAAQAESRVLERMRHQQSMIEYQWSKTALARAAARLRLTGKNINN